MNKTTLQGTLAVVTILVLAAAAAAHADNDNWRFQLEGIPKTVEDGTAYQIHVRFVPAHMGLEATENDGANRLGYYVLDLTFDPTVVNVDSVEFDDRPGLWQADSGAFGLPTHEIDNTAGRIRYLNGISFGSYWPDDLNNHLATITFTALQDSTTAGDMWQWEISEDGSGDPMGTLVDFYPHRDAAEGYFELDSFPSEDLDTLLTWTVDRGDGTVTHSCSYYYLKYLGLLDYRVWREDWDPPAYTADAFPWEKAIDLANPPDPPEEEITATENSEVLSSGITAIRQALRFIHPENGDYLSDGDGWEWRDQVRLFTGDSYIDPPAGAPDSGVITPGHMEYILNRLTYTSYADTEKVHPYWHRYYHFSHLPDRREIYEDEDASLELLIHWIDYDVRHAAPDHAENVPAQIPMNGSFDNWMTVRGFASSGDPMLDDQLWTVPDGIVLRGFWLNNPLADNRAVGANVFMTAETLKTAYEPIDGRYHFVAEPPPVEIRSAVEAQLDAVHLEYAGGIAVPEVAEALRSEADLRARAAAEGDDALPGAKFLQRKAAVENSFAAIEWGRTIPGELLSTPGFYEAFADSAFQGSHRVHDLSQNAERNLILLGKTGTEYSASVVLLVDGEDGALQQATWVPEEQQYLSPRRARDLALSRIREDYPVSRLSLMTWYKRGVVRDKKGGSCEADELGSRLVWSPDLSPSVFQPVHEVSTPFGLTVYVKQDGSLDVTGELDPDYVAVAEGPETGGDADAAAAAGRPAEQASLLAAVTEFEARALSSLPLLSVAAFAQEHPDDADLFRPAEVWLRLLDDYSGAPETVMAEAASLYREITGYGRAVRVTLWRGSALEQTRDY